MKMNNEELNTALYGALPAWTGHTQYRICRTGR